MTLRAIRPAFAALFLIAVPVAAAAQDRHVDIVWTEPAQPVAGQPTRLIFDASLPAPPVASVEIADDAVVIVLTVDCTTPCFATNIPWTIELTLPALSAGEYELGYARRIVHTGIPTEPEPVVALATLHVAAESSVERILPAQGFWSPVAQPGSGLFLETRGELMAVASYSFEPRFPAPTPPPAPATWALGTGTWRGNTVPLVMTSFHGGDCLGCSGHVAPSGNTTKQVIRLRFESARRAGLDVAGEFSVPLTSLPYGADYLPVTLTDTVDDTWGPLPLPDLRGRWLFTIEGVPALQPVELRDVAIEGGEVAFGRGSIDELVCRAATTSRRAGCVHSGSIILDPPPPAPFDTFYQGGTFFPLGDIEEDRMRGVIEADGQRWRVRAVRVSPAPGASDSNG